MGSDVGSEMRSEVGSVVGSEVGWGVRSEEGKLDGSAGKSRVRIEING